MNLPFLLSRLKPRKAKRKLKWNEHRVGNRIVREHPWGWEFTDLQGVEIKNADRPRPAPTQKYATNYPTTLDIYPRVQPNISTRALRESLRAQTSPIYINHPRYR